MIVGSDKRGWEYSIRSFLSSILDGPRRVTGQPERNAGLFVFKDSNFALLSGIELCSRLLRVLALTDAVNNRELTLTLLTLTDTLGTVKERLQPYASSTLAESSVSTH